MKNGVQSGGGGDAFPDGDRVGDGGGGCLKPTGFISGGDNDCIGGDNGI